MKFDSASSFGKHLKDATPHHLSSLYIILCPHAYERQKVFGGILSAIRQAKSDATILKFSAQEGKIPKALEEIASLSLFGEEKIVILDALEEAKKGEMEALECALSAPLSASTLLLGSSQARPLQRLLTIVKKEAVILDLLKEKPWDRKARLQKWLSAHFKRGKKEISAKALEALFASAAEDDFALLEQEAEKLITFVGSRERVTEEDVSALLTGSPKEQLWKVAEALVWDHNPEAVDAVQESSDLFILMAAVRSQLQTGLKMAECLERQEEIELASVRAFPKTLEKYKMKLASLKRSYFEEGLRALFECELKAKNSSHPPELLWHHLCLKIDYAALSTSQSSH